MFDFLKKKIGTWFKKEEEIKEKKPKKTKKSKIVATKKEKQDTKKPVKGDKTPQVITPSNKNLKSNKNEKITTKPQKIIPTKEKTQELTLPHSTDTEIEQEVDRVVDEEENEDKDEEDTETEVKVEKKGFFSKIFSKTKKDEKSEAVEKEKQDIKEKVIEKQKETKIEPIITEQEVDQSEEDEEENEDKDEEDSPKETTEEVEKEGNFFTKILKKITTSKLSKDEFDDIFQEFEITLLENNVAYEAVEKIKENLSNSLVNQLIKPSQAEEKILSSLKEAILSVLIEPPNLIENIKNHQGIFTIVFFGINGTGKTTTIAKIANLLKKENISCVLAAADTFRAASIEQLKVHATKLDVPIISSNYGADPASVAFEANKYAKAHNIKVVLIDTAGRMYTKANLLKEMEKIMRVSSPNLKIFVGESITGNDVIDQAKTFNEAIGIDGIVLSKADVDEKAGAILSVSHVTGKPIYFLGIGQNYEDLLPFTKKTVLKNLGLEN